HRALAREFATAVQSHIATMTIREHPLAWRWTDQRYALLPDNVLAQMQPVEPHEAVPLFSHSRAFSGENGLAPDIFTIATVRAEALPQEAVWRWLRQRQPDLQVPVVISWEQHIAIRTTWEIFTAHWDDFCYPSSDDVLVWPDSESWTLLYRHDQEFQFGRRPAV